QDVDIQLARIVDRLDAQAANPLQPLVRIEVVQHAGQLGQGHLSLDREAELVVDAAGLPPGNGADVAVAHAMLLHQLEQPRLVERLRFFAIARQRLRFKFGHAARGELPLAHGARLLLQLPFQGAQLLVARGERSTHAGEDVPHDQQHHQTADGDGQEPFTTGHERPPFLAAAAPGDGCALLGLATGGATTGWVMTTVSLNFQPYEPPRGSDCAPVPMTMCRGSLSEVSMRLITPGSLTCPSSVRVPPCGSRLAANTWVTMASSPFGKCCGSLR